MAPPSHSNMEALYIPKISFTKFSSSSHRTKARIKVNPPRLFLSSKILKPNSKTSLIGRRNFNFATSINCLAKSTHSQHQHDRRNHEHHHHHHHHHCHGNGEYAFKLTKSQEAFLKFANTIKRTHLANFLRENLELCCCSAALLVAATACPYLVPKPAVKPLQQVFTLIAFPLVGVSALLDALTDIAGGKINFHVLMALAAFASVFMENFMEGSLLLAMFNWLTLLKSTLPVVQKLL